ncbi:MAG: hypothetical protein H7257_00310, partial [Taibaiella sp.]|nr:hypothetical protein [Taibaiella sp.]
MHYLKAILLFIYITLPVTTTAQNMQGTITDAVNGSPMNFVRITNMRTSQTSVIDHNGFYTIPANTGETIVFCYIGYNITRKKKPKCVLISTLNLAMAPP